MIHVNANGATIPSLGFGTWDLRDRVAQEMVSQALEAGYRHIDTAQMYGNEREVGAAIAASSLPRDEIFLTTKIWPDRFHNGELQRAAEESIKNLQVDAVDLLLLHWPNADIPLSETISALNEIKEKGLARHIGISNFTTRLIDEAVSLSAAPLINNQVEYHPFLNQDKVLQKARSHGLAVTAYCPIARGKVFGNETIERIGGKYGKNASQTTLRWLVQQDGVIAIPRTSKVANARTNIEIFDFALTDNEMAEISALAMPNGRMVSPAVAPDWDN